MSRKIKKCHFSICGTNPECQTCPGNTCDQHCELCSTRCPNCNASCTKCHEDCENRIAPYSPPHRV